MIEGQRCEDCRFWSATYAHWDSEVDLLTCYCLNEAGLWYGHFMAGEDRCGQFEEGKPVDWEIEQELEQP